MIFSTTKCEACDMPLLPGAEREIPEAGHMLVCKDGCVSSFIRVFDTRPVAVQVAEQDAKIAAMRAKIRRIRDGRNSSPLFS